MARWFRLLEKKRGDRHTVSQTAAGVGEAVFFGVMFLIGAAWLSALIGAQLTASSVKELQIGYGFWLMVLLMTSFVLIGGTGVIWAVLQIGTSVERRSALARRAEEMVAEEEPRPDFPGIPTYEGLTDSPGTELAFRLPCDHSPGWSLLAATTFCLLWNGSVFGLAGYAIQSHVNMQPDRRPEWLLTGLLFPFAAVGIWSIYYLAQLLYRLTGLGTTTLEISAHPILPGEPYEIVLCQGGHIHVKHLEVWLVCQEEATYRQGTDVRTESRVVYEERLFQAQDIDVEPASPFRAKFAFELPIAAMHSFQTAHSGVHWRLVVDGSVVGWSDFERGFPIIVHPGVKTIQAWEPTPAKFLPATRSAPRTAAAAGVSA